MLSEFDALVLMRTRFPSSRIVPFLDYKNLYLYQVFNDQDTDEGDFDPFYSVDKDTRLIQEFSVLTDANPQEIAHLWAKRRSEQ